MADSFPIENIVVLMLENRSFDHIFGFRPGVEGLTGTESNLLDPDQPGSGSNPAFPVGNTAPFKVSDTEGPAHNLISVNVQLYNSTAGPSGGAPAKNNGFARDYSFDLHRRVSNPTAQQIGEVMLSFTPDKLPSIHALADAFCLCDHWHCEVPGPTMPNRFYVHAATSAGYVHNAFKQPFNEVQTIYGSLGAAGHTWATYFFDLNEVFQFFPEQDWTPEHFKRFETQFAQDVQQDALPTYSFILPRFMHKAGGPMANSQHAPRSCQEVGKRIQAAILSSTSSSRSGRPFL